VTRNALGTAAVAAHEAIVRLCAGDLPAIELLEQVAIRVRTVVPYATGGWLPTDPGTMLYTGAYTEDVPGELHLDLFENELADADFAKFSEIVALPRPVLTLGDATDGDLTRSVRHRRIHAPAGLRSELRAVFRTGGSCWGVACLSRTEDAPDFSPAEVDFVAGICEHVGHALRTALLLEAHDDATAAAHAPGMVILTDDDEIEALTGEAERWLAALPRDGLELPSVVYGVARRARAAAADGADQPPARARVRLPGGGWLVVHAARLRGSSAPDRTAVVVEPARRAELAPLILELHDLTERERQVTQLLVSGKPIDAIAQTLWISPHTVRDHVKAVFAKLGVSSRPELTAMLFHEHVLPAVEAPAD